MHIYIFIFIRFCIDYCQMYCNLNCSACSVNLAMVDCYMGEHQPQTAVLVISVIPIRASANNHAIHISYWFHIFACSQTDMDCIGRFFDTMATSQCALRCKAYAFLVHFEANGSCFSKQWYREIKVLKYDNN